MERGEPWVPKNYPCAACGYTGAEKQKIKAGEVAGRNWARYKETE